MINLEFMMTFFSHGGESYTFSYDHRINKMQLSNDKYEIMTVDNAEMFHAMDTIFKLRGDHEFIK